MRSKRFILRVVKSALPVSAVEVSEKGYTFYHEVFYHFQMCVSTAIILKYRLVEILEICDNGDYLPKCSASFDFV